jgi:uncharacterized membrane protein
MNSFIIICGFFAGIFLYPSLDKSLVGAVLGAFLAFLLVQVMALKDRVTSLEKQKGKDEQPAKIKSPTRVQEAAYTTKVTKESPVAAKKPAPEPLPELEVQIEPTQERTASQSIPQPPPQPAESSAPEKPGLDDKTGEPPLELWDIVISYFTGGNVVVRVGILVLFFGVAFLLKYSIDNNLLPIELRLAGIYIGGIALLIVGWKLRNSRTVYALILQGGGVGILYLTTFGAMKLYHLLPFGFALFLMVCLSGFSAALAVIQDARSLAVIGITGGFLAPILTSTGEGNHIMLFSYYALLNGGIFLTAWHKSWRELNLLGFVFTFVVGAMWGSRSYHPELFASTEPFLILFFLYYLVIGILFARNQPLAHKGYIDCTMVFGTPLVAFALQTSLVRPYEYGLAWSALVLGLIYALVARLIFSRGNAAMRTLVESFFALGVVFGTIAIPLALDGRWTSAAWALEGSAIVWIAIRQKRDLARLFGLLLQFLAGLAFLSAVREPTGSYALINGFFLGCLAISFAGLFCSYCLILQKDTIETSLLESTLALAWGLLWWFGGGLHEIDSFTPHNYKLAATLIYFAFSGLGFTLAGKKLAWDELCQVYKALPLVLVVGALYSLVVFQSRPSIHGGWIAWPIACWTTYLLLFFEDRKRPGELLPALHLTSFLLVVWLFTREFWWWTDSSMRGEGVWAQVVAGLVPGFFVFAVSRFRKLFSWPVMTFPQTYLYHGLGTISLFLFLGSIYINLTSTGNPSPLPYLPFFNPLDLTQVFVMGTLIYWFLLLRTELKLVPFGLDLLQLIKLVGAMVFFWLNCILIRTIHHWGGVPFNARDMLASDLVQTSLSIFWTLAAFAVMFWATKKSQRIVWLVGSGLIGIVVLKLFVFDLANTDTIERIISFLGVGALCLVIGYLAPMPQKAAQEATK